jgi:hypothetical protein
MQDKDDKGKSAIVTQSGKQILLQNDLERVFNNDSFSQSFLMQNREPYNEIRKSFYLPSPGDLEFKAFNSPMIYGLSFSPLKSGGVSFYETFSKRFKNQKQQGGDDSSQTKNISKFEGITPDIIDLAEREPVIHSSLLHKTPRLLTSCAQSMFSDSNRMMSMPESPFQIEKTKMDNSTAEVSNNDKKEILIPQLMNFDYQTISIYGNSLVNLRNLFNVLNHVFNHREISIEEYEVLNSFEEELLNSILQRKFLKKLRPRDFELDTDKKVDLINEITNTKSHKRPEECYKFILTRVIKHLKKYLKTLDRTNMDLESFFYEYFFTSTADLLGLQLSDFHYPLTGNKEKIKLNSKYFGRIFKSTMFLEKLETYMNGLLESDYTIEIAKKLDSLLARWDGMLVGASDPQNIECSIREYLLKNKRCKLPWTINEVHESVDRFSILLKNYKSNGNSSKEFGN